HRSLKRIYRVRDVLLRDGERDGGSASLLALDLETSAVKPEDMPGQAESESGAGICFGVAAAEKRLHEKRNIQIGDADPLVNYLYRDALRRRISPYRDGAFGR